MQSFDATQPPSELHEGGAAPPPKRRASARLASARGDTLARWLSPITKPRLTRADAPVSWRRVRNELLVPAFKKLRAAGVLARHTRLEWCQSSAAHAFGQLSDQWLGYHLQSIPERLDDEWEDMYLMHCLEPETKPLVRRTLLEAGLVVDWDGSDDKTIRIALPQPPKHWWGVLRRACQTRAIYEFWREAYVGPLYAPGGRYHVPLDQVMAGDAPLPPAGVTEAFKDVWLMRHGYEVEFAPPYNPDWTLPDESPDGRPWDSGCSTYWREQICWRAMGCDVESIELSAEACEHDELRPLKGAELDAIAFVGDVLKLRSYELMGDMRDGKKPSRVWELKAPVHRGQRYFTVAELQRALEPVVLWQSRCEQFAGELHEDACFFEGLRQHDDGCYTFDWGV